MTMTRNAIPRNRDIDLVLVFFLCLFALLEGPNFLRVAREEEELSSPAVQVIEKYDDEKNVTNNASDDNATGVENDLDGDDHSEIIIDTRPSIAVNWDHVIASKESGCDLIMDGKDAPLPLLFVGLGRSGSFVTWATIAKMMGDVNPEKAIEITGRNQNESRSFFNNSIPDEIADSWPCDYICDLQHNLTATKVTTRDKNLNDGHQDGYGWGIVGFQWKPFAASFDTPKAWSGFQNIANEKIKVVYQRRNPIDKRLSNMRHHGQRDAVPAHCHRGDGECMKKHEQQETMHEFLSGQELIHWLNASRKHQEQVLKRMDEIGIDYINVAYEKLYMNEDNNNAREWKRLFKFLGWDDSRVESITYEEIQSTFDVVKTSSKTHKDLISNYDEVKDTLEGTQYADLLN